MIHFAYLIGFAVLAGVVVGAISTGDTKAKVKAGVKIFAQFTLISIGLAWIFFFIPW